MNIKLKHLRIENFKGIKKFSMDFDGKNVNVFGTNATGKTTLVDAFQWVLFDKDSLGNSKFGIKPIDVRTEKEMHHLETMVEVVLALDGEEINLKKVFKEKWTKQRGQADEEFSGHTTDYFIDGVKKRKTDYVNKVNEIVDENVFRMITNVFYFNQNLDWGTRRNIILSLVPDLPAEKVIKYKPELKHIQDELEKRDVEDLILIYKAEKKKQNDLLNEIPIRIDELLKNDFNVLKDFDPENANSRIKYLNEKLDDIRSKKSESNVKSLILNLEAEIKNLLADKRELENFKSEKQEKLDAIVEEGRKLKNQIDDLKNKIKHLESDIEFEKNNEKSLLTKKEKLYEEYDLEKAKEFTDDKCAYCGQALPEEEQERLRKKFNSKKVEKLEDIKREGLEINNKIGEIRDRQDDLEKEITNLKIELNHLENQRKEKLVEYDKIKDTVEENPNLEKIKNIDAKVAKLEETLNSFKDKDKVNPFEEEELKINEELSKLNRLNSLYEQQIEIEKRVAELEKQKKEAASNYSVANNKLVLCEMFVVAKAELLEKEINDNFELVKFKMFEKQVNGGINETCVATVNGVDYADLNNAMKINAGLDIIRSLQKIYGVIAPIFIDNAESVTKFIELPNTQFIKLYVSEEDKSLRFEREETL